MLKIVEYSAERLVDCVKCYKAVYDDEDWTDEEVEYNLSVVMNNTYSVGVLAYEENECIGFAIGNVFYMRHEKYAILDEICVIRKYQGKKVGSNLLAEFERKSKGLGAYAICLEHYNFDSLNSFYTFNSYLVPEDRIVRNKSI